jgi:hypothetical protein
MGRSEYTKQIYFHFWPNKQVRGKNITLWQYIPSVADLGGGPPPLFAKKVIYMVVKFRIWCQKWLKVFLTPPHILTFLDPPLSIINSFHLKTKDYLPHAYLYPSTDLAQFHGTVFYSFHDFLFRISNFFGLSTTQETWLVEMRIWCIKIGIVLVLHLYIVLLIIIIFWIWALFY